MTNTSDLYWEARDVSLHTYAWAIETVGGRLARPAKRGSDIVVPFQPGQQNTRKVRESRQENLPMWVAPFNPDGSIDTTMTEKAKMYSNWEYLMDLFDVEGQFDLRKRMYGPDGVSIVSAVAKAEMIEPPAPTVVAQHTLKFNVPLVLADPYYYGSAQTADLAVGPVVVPGSAPTSRFTITAWNGRITFPDGNWVQYDGFGQVTIDFDTKNSVKDGLYVNGLIQRNLNFPDWPRLQPGSNAIDSDTGGSITFSPAYK